MGKRDITEKRLIANNDVFTDIYNNITFHGNQLLDSASLVSIPTESYTRKQDGSRAPGIRKRSARSSKAGAGNHYGIVLWQKLGRTGKPSRAAGFSGGVSGITETAGTGLSFKSDTGG